MNSLAYIVHAVITRNQMPAAEMSPVEQAALDELRPLLQAAPQDISDMTPRASGWTMSAVSDDARLVA